LPLKFHIQDTSGEQNSLSWIKSYDAHNQKTHCEHEWHSGHEISFAEETEIMNYWL